MLGNTGFHLSGPPRFFWIQEPCRYSMMSTARKRSVGSLSDWLLVVCHTFREDARRADRREAGQYQET
jgi:uncharacterized DUF497 family protein